MRARLAFLLTVALILASCGASSTASPSTVPEPTAAPSAIATAPGPSTSAPTAIATPGTAGHWESAGDLAAGRAVPHVVRVGDGGVLVVGNDDCGYDLLDWGPFGCTCACIRIDSRIVEAWSPSSRRWTTVGPLSAPRADLAVVALADGRVLATGGVQELAGKDPERPWLAEEHHASLARTSIFDPGTGHWTRVGDMTTPRTAPIAAVLQDGRVLVAGGYDLDAPTGPWTHSPGGLAPGAATYAAYRSTRLETAGSVGILANVTPGGPNVPVLATAELYDPVTDTWSATGPLRLARFGDAAITLTDGRVLVVPDVRNLNTMMGDFGWDRRPAVEHELAQTVTEVYDPRTGRFSVAGEIPPIDWSPLTALGYKDIDGRDVYAGSLVALGDGSALLVGRSTYWGDWVETEVGGGATGWGYYVRTFRFDPSNNTWSEVDRSVLVDRDLEDADGTTEQVATGHLLPGAVAAGLADGRVLVAGGIRSAPGYYDGAGALASEEAAIYDPVADTWATLPSLPMPRFGGAAIALVDGSIVLVGGSTERARPGSPDDCGSGATGIASTIRFVPGP